MELLENVSTDRDPFINSFFPFIKKKIKQTHVCTVKCIWQESPEYSTEKE